MTEDITKKDLENVLDKKFGEYQGAIVEAVDFKFQALEQKLEMGFQGVEAEIAELRTDIRRLTNTLDNFLKRLTDHEDEFQILKAEVSRIKTVLKEKLGVEVAI